MGKIPEGKNPEAPSAKGGFKFGVKKKKKKKMSVAKVVIFTLYEYSPGDEKT